MSLLRRVAVTCYRRERWETATGERIVAPLPPGILGGFDPELRRLIAAGHFQGQVSGRAGQRSRGSGRVDLLARHHSPGDTRCLVGESDSRDLHWLPFEELRQPSVRLDRAAGL